MRFNPPPNWPAPPEGWVPPAGWTPDPSLPPPPPGWRLWIEGEPLASVTEADHQRKHAVRSFWIGIAFFVASSVAIYVASRNGGGVIWYGGLVVGIASLVRAVVSYRSSRASGGPALTSRAMAVVGVALLVSVVAGGVAASSWVESESLTATVGSCWKLDGDDAVAVPCSASHSYRAIAEVTDEAQCPQQYVGTVQGDAGKLLCVADD